ALLARMLGRRQPAVVPVAVFLEGRWGVRAGGIAASVVSAGVSAGDPARLSARDAFPSLGAMAEKGSLLLHAIRRPKGPRAGIWTLRGGLGTLPEALAKSLGLRIRLGTRARQLAPSEDGWSVQGERFDGVVLAVPAAAAAELTRGFAPRFADLAGQFQSAPVAVVHVGLRQEALPRGFGMIDSEGTLHSVGTLLPSSMLPGRAPEGRALVTAICGGARHPERAALGDRELVAGVMRDLRSAWGVGDEPDYVRIVRWPEAIPQYAPGH